jgi:hypothetical protein
VLTDATKRSPGKNFTMTLAFVSKVRVESTTWLIIGAVALDALAVVVLYLETRLV